MSTQGPAPAVRGAHTPGPWIVNGNDSPMRGTVTATGEPDEYGRTQRVVAYLVGRNGIVQETEQPNAHLIAAAPDLLACLREMLDTHSAGARGENVGDWLEARRRAVEAIARAHGEGSR